MITSQVVAEVRRVLRGHSDRALVHAVDGEGLEYKIEVPLDQVRALNEEQGHVVTITYAIHTLPGLAPPAADLEEAPSPAGDASADASEAGARSTTAGEAMGTRDPAAVDAEFMALMNRRSQSTSTTSSTSSSTAPTSTTSPSGAPSTPAGAPLGAPATPQPGASSAEALAPRSAGLSRPVTTTAPGAEADPLADIFGDLR